MFPPSNSEGHRLPCTLSLPTPSTQGLLSSSASKLVEVRWKRASLFLAVALLCCPQATSFWTGSPIPCSNPSSCDFLGSPGPPSCSALQESQPCRPTSVHACSPVDRAVPSNPVALPETLLNGKSIFSEQKSRNMSIDVHMVSGGADTAGGPSSRPSSLAYQLGPSRLTVMGPLVQAALPAALKSSTSLSCAPPVIRSPHGSQRDLLEM